MSSFLNLFKKASAPVAGPVPALTKMNVSDETVEEIISVLKSVGFFDDRDMRESIMDASNYEDGDMEYTERAIGLRFWIEKRADNTLRSMAITPHGYTGLAMSTITSANRSLMAIILA